MAKVIASRNHHPREKSPKNKTTGGINWGLLVADSGGTLTANNQPTTSTAHIELDGTDNPPRSPARTFAAAAIPPALPVASACPRHGTVT